MFGFLKKKLKGALSKFSKDVEEEVQVEEVKEVVEEKPKVSKPVKKKEPKPIKEKPAETSKKEAKPKVKKEEKVPEVKEEKAPEPTVKEEPKVAEEEAPKEKKGFLKKLFSKKEEAPKEKKTVLTKITETITKKAISEKKFEELFFDLEVGLLESNVAVEVIEKIKADLKKELVDAKVLRGTIPEVIQNTLKKSLSEILNVEEVDIFDKIKAKKPYVICFVGVNGSGKTTTIAKFIKLLQDNNLKSVVAASDTFRAAAIQQLEEHATKLHTKIIKHDYGSDPAAVAFDAIKYAEQKGLDVVLIDTAGRLHSNANLMAELDKIIRVAKPDFKIFIGESITGNDCVFQATQFNETVGVDAIILAKADVDEKGGAAVSVSYVTKKPVIYLGMGQEYKDLEEFNKDKILESLGL